MTDNEIADAARRLCEAKKRAYAVYVKRIGALTAEPFNKGVYLDAMDAGRALNEQVMAQESTFWDMVESSIDDTTSRGAEEEKGGEGR